MGFVCGTEPWVAWGTKRASPGFSGRGRWNLLLRARALRKLNIHVAEACVLAQSLGIEHRSRLGQLEEFQTAVTTRLVDQQNNEEALSPKMPFLPRRLDLVI